jgi:hypothetical protein
VDEMIQVGEEELADKPHLDGLRRRLLELALVYYQEFIDQRRDDPAAQAELRDTKARVEKILADLAVLQGAGHLLVLGRPAVLDDLGLPAQQRRRVGELSRRMGERWRHLFRQLGRLPPEERRRQSLELARATEAELNELLTPAQQRRLRQVALQLQGLAAFRDPGVAAALKLTAAQREQLRAVEAETFFGQMEAARPGTPRDELRKAHEDRLKAGLRRAVALLTPGQVRTWKELTGEPFQGAAALPPFGPPP